MTDDQPTISIIVAMTADRIIGQAGHLPWSLPEDLRLFRKLTLGGTLIMGRRTFQSLPGLLDDRNHLVISNSLPRMPGVSICRNWQAARQKAFHLGQPIWVIGGAALYREALDDADHIAISWVHGTYPGDVSFPPLSQKDWELLCQVCYQGFTHCRYRRRKRNSPEAYEATGLLTPPSDSRAQ